MKSKIWNRVIVFFCVTLLLAAAAIIAQHKVKAAPPSGGEVTGTIELDGTPPHQKPIDMSKEPSCAAIHKDHPVTTEGVVAGPDGGLQNVVVYISEGWSGAPVTPSSEPVFDQKGCQYIPHVRGLDVNEHVKVVNGDQT